MTYQFETTALLNSDESDYKSNVAMFVESGLTIATNHGCEKATLESDTIFKSLKKFNDPTT